MTKDTLPRLSRSLIAPLAMTVLFLAAGAPLHADAGRGETARRQFEALHGLQGAASVPDALGEPLDMGLVALGDETKPRAKADWLRRLEARGGMPTFVPLRELDPSQELLVLVPGNGMNVQDTHALVSLDDTYQVIVAIYDARRPVFDVGSSLADALEEVLTYRDELGRAAGVTPSRRLRLVGHSFGSAASHVMLGELSGRGSLGTSIPEVLFVPMDGPWRGADVPWFLTLPGVKHVASWLAVRLKIHKGANAGNFSFINRTKTMKSVRTLQMPPCVRTEFVTVVGKQGTSPRWRHFEPIAGWCSEELGKGELELVWRFYDDGARRTRELESWSTPLITKRFGLVNLIVTLARDADYAEHLPHLIAAARESSSAEEFGLRYDSIVGRIVDTFRGQHTQFMWTDAAFMPWMRATLSGWTPGVERSEAGPG